MLNLPQTRFWTAMEIALGVLLPPTGLIIACVLFATDNRRPAAYVFVASLVGLAFWIPLLV